MMIGVHPLIIFYFSVSLQNRFSYTRSMNDIHSSMFSTLLSLIQLIDLTLMVIHINMITESKVQCY